MSEIKITTILESSRAVVLQIVYYFPRCAAVWGALAFSALALASGMARTASAQALAKSSEIMVHTVPDESSLLVETVRSSERLSPIAETTSAGVKWFMVKTGNGNIGWIKADDNAEAKKMDNHFRALPKDTTLVGPLNPNGAPESVTKSSERGVSRVPILIRGSRVYVVVTFNKRVSKYLLLDTGAYQTVISKRIASDLGLPAIDRRTSYGVAGPVAHDVGLLDSIRVGGFELRNFRVSVFDHTSTPNDEGLLGFDFLGLFHVSIDPEKQEMVLTPRKR